MTLCQLMKEPATYSGKLVSIRAEVSVGFEYQAIIDHSCPDQRVWFELPDDSIHGFNDAEGAWKNNPWNLKRKVEANIIGRWRTGDCFGHDCFSKSVVLVSQLANVTSVLRRQSKHLTRYDCTLLHREVRTSFERGHIDNPLDAPLVLQTLNVVLTDHTNFPLSAKSRAALQLADAHNKIHRLNQYNGRSVRLDGLPPGAYPFTAVAQGFQSVSGCIVIDPRIKALTPFRIQLPLGL